MRKKTWRERSKKGISHTELQTLERMTKRLGQKMMEKMGWIPGTPLGSKTVPAPSPMQANTWRMERPPRAGIGTAIWNLVLPRFDTMWNVSLRKIRRTDTVPLAMLRSQSSSADKGNQKPGIGSMCVAWHSGIHGRAEKIDMRRWAHGGLPHRSRECALTVVQQNQWRLNELGLGSVLSNFDGTNAFGATRRELLISPAQKAAKENDRMFAAESLQHGSMTLQARDGRVTLMPSSGAPRDFNDCYNPQVDQWRQNLTDETGAGTKTLRSPGSRAARDVESLSGGTARQTWRGTRQKKNEKCIPFLGSVAGCGRVASAKGMMVPKLGETPKGSPRGGHGSAGNVQSRRNCRSPTFDERGKCMSVQYPDGNTNG